MRVARSQAGHGKHQHRAHQHGLAAKLVGQGAGAHGTAGQAKQGRAEHGSQIGLGHAPLRNQRRSDIADGSGIKAIEQNDKETQGENHPLVTGERMFVQYGLHIGDRIVGCRIASLRSHV